MEWICYSESYNATDIQSKVYYWVNSNETFNLILSFSSFSPSSRIHCKFLTMSIEYSRVFSFADNLARYWKLYVDGKLKFIRLSFAFTVTWKNFFSSYNIEQFPKFSQLKWPLWTGWFATFRPYISFQFSIHGDQLPFAHEASIRTDTRWTCFVIHAKFCFTNK